MRDKLSFLRSLDLFAHAPEAVLERVAETLEERRVSAGEWVPGEAEHEHEHAAAYLIVEGEVRFGRNDRSSSGESGDWIGETALLDAAPTITSAVATTDVIVLKWSRADFQKALADGGSAGAMAGVERKLRGYASSRAPSRRSSAGSVGSLETLDTPPGQQRHRRAPIRERISHYTIVGELGHGGMGDVYAAFDETLERKVALKAIRSDHRLSDSARSRFLREARVLSQLDHPNICRIHDYIEQDGSDFLVLELIEGTNLRDAIREGLDERLKMRIAIQIAEVLVAAHAEGIVHRDLKPENVMLMADDGVKVLDFGLARTNVRRFEAGARPKTESDADSSAQNLPSARSESESESESEPSQESTLTELGHVVGTLRYMSPEQARGKTATPASDMYSFGLLLEELYSERVPYEDADDRNELLARVQRGETAPTAGLQSEVAALVRQLKSVAPTRRPTAVETTERLRWIRDKPRRRLRRLAAASVLVLLVLAGLKYTIDLERERTIAEQRRDQAEDLIGFMLGDLRDKLEPIGRLDILDDVGDQALDYFAAVSDSELSEEELFRRSRALSQIGDVRIEQGELDRAVAPLEESLRVAEALVARDPTNGEWQLGLGATHFWLGAVAMNRGALDVALEHWEAYLSIAEELVKRDPESLLYLSELGMAQGNLGDVHEAKGELDKAREMYEASLSIGLLIEARSSTEAARDDLASAHNKLARVRDRIGDLKGARDHYARELEIREALLEQDPEDARKKLRLGTSRYFLGQVLEVMGEPDAAWEHYLPAHGIMSELVASDPTNTRWRRNLADTHLMLARTHADRGDNTAAMNDVMKGLETFEALVASEPLHARWRSDLAEARVLRGRLLESVGRVDEAMAEARAAADAMERILTENPEDSRAPIELCSALILQGRLLERAGEAAGARQAWERAILAIADRAKGSRDWRYLDPWARALLHAGADDEAKTIVTTLATAGYRSHDFVALCERFGLRPQIFSMR